jgi:hypothetical protein
VDRYAAADRYAAVDHGAAVDRTEAGHFGVQAVNDAASGFPFCDLDCDRYRLAVLVVRCVQVSRAHPVPGL